VLVASEDVARRRLDRAAALRKNIPTVAGIPPSANSNAHHLMVAVAEVALIKMSDFWWRSVR